MGRLPPPPLEKQGEAWVPPPGSDVYECLKTPHRLVRGQYRGSMWAKEEGSWWNLEICMSPKVGGGSRDPLLVPPPPWRMRGREPPCPPGSYACGTILLCATACETRYSFYIHSSLYEIMLVQSRSLISIELLIDAWPIHN